MDILRSHSYSVYEYYIINGLDGICKKIKNLSTIGYERGRRTSLKQLKSHLIENKYKCYIFIHRTDFDNPDSTIYYEIMLCDRSRACKSYLSRYYLTDTPQNRMEAYEMLYDRLKIKIETENTEEEKLYISRLTVKYNKILNYFICKVCEKMLKKYNIKHSVTIVEKMETNKMLKFRLKLELPDKKTKLFYSEFYEESVITNSKDKYMEAIATISYCALKFMEDKF